MNIKQKHIFMKHFLIILAFMLSTTAFVNAQENSTPKSNKDKLVLILSSDDPMVAQRVALMYSHAAKRNDWFKEVTLVIWGPSAKMVATNQEIQKRIKQMMKDGIPVKACIACTNGYGVTDQLKELGIEVIPMGIPLTNYLKEDYSVLTF